MHGYKVILLKDFVDELGEDRVKSILSDFYCPLNKDVELFIKEKAIEFAKQGVAATHLVFMSYRGELRLVGYYTLASKCFCISSKKLSNNLRRRLSKFTTYFSETKTHIIPAPLIAQLGKNYKDNLNQLIPGNELLKMACDKVSKIQSEISGRIVYLECEDKVALTEFYTKNGFFNFGERPLDKDETSLMSGKSLVQMLKYLK